MSKICKHCEEKVSEDESIGPRMILVGKPGGLSVNENSRAEIVLWQCPVCKLIELV